MHSFFCIFTFGVLRQCGVLAAAQAAIADTINLHFLIVVCFDSNAL